MTKTEITEKRIHYMHSDEVLRIAKKTSEELPYLIQPSSTDVALAHLYAMYVYKPSLWNRVKCFFLIVYVNSKLYDIRWV